jgi:hypothetical protein
MFPPMFEVGTIDDGTISSCLGSVETQLTSRTEPSIIAVHLTSSKRLRSREAGRPRQCGSSREEPPEAPTSPQLLNDFHVEVNSQFPPAVDRLIPSHTGQLATGKALRAFLIRADKLHVLAAGLAGHTISPLVGKNGHSSRFSFIGASYSAILPLECVFSMG